MRLQTQFSLALLPVLLLSGGALTHLARLSVHRIIVEDTADRGKERLQQLALDSAVDLEEDSERALLPLLTTATNRLGAIYAVALDVHGKVVAHTSVLEKGKTYKDALTHHALEANEPLTSETIWQNQPVADLAWPVWQSAGQNASTGEDFILSAGQELSQRRRVGTLRVGIPLNHSIQIEDKIVRNLTVLLVCVGGLLLGISILLTQNILRPVNNLVNATEDIARGHYDTKLSIPSALELATLAQSFNRMVEALGQTTVSKEFLDSILTNMLDPLVVLNADTSIRMVNRATLHLLGYSAGDLLEQPASILFDQHSQAPDSKHQSGPVSDQECAWKAKGGLKIPVLFSSTLFSSKENRALGWILVAKDIRERKKLERDKVQSEKLTAVGRLASGVAHEVNNPLGVILGFTQGILWDIQPGDPLEGPLKAIERETLRCKNLVQDLLNFSRVSKTEREPMTLNTAAESALSLVTAQARLGKVEVVKEFASELPQILGNPNQIQQVIINLANNALDAMNKCGTLTIKTGRLNDSGHDWVTLSVIDTGPGIPAEVVPHIFEPFFTTKSAGQGTGMGLGLVAEIIQKHSATIDVRTRPGRTEFEIRFPMLTPKENLNT